MAGFAHNVVFYTRFRLSSIVSPAQHTTPITRARHNTATFSQSGIVLAELQVNHEMCNENVGDALIYVEAASKRTIWKDSLSAPTETTVLIGYAAAGTPMAWQLGGTCHLRSADGTRQEWACATDEWPCVWVTAYVVPLPVCNEGCDMCQCSAGQAADPVDTWTGAFSHRETDFALPTLGARPDL